MRYKLLTFLFLFVTTITFSQKSPAKEATGSADEVSIAIKYSSPSVKGRDIYGSLVPYGQVWRAGANKNTTIEFDKNVFINGKKLEAGKYGLFMIPNKNNKWVVIFSSDSNAWGAYNYIEENDALRVEVNSKQNNQSQEELLYNIVAQGVQFSWSNQTVTIPIERAKR